jgi:hypothetical protein
MDPETGVGMIWILKGRSHHPKNISIIETDEDYFDIMEYEQIIQMKKRNIVQEIPEIPTSYYSAVEMAGKHAKALQDAKAEQAEKDRLISEKDARIAELEKKLADNKIE